LTDNLVFRTKFNELRDRYSDYHSVYTDGSKEGERVAAAAVGSRRTLSSRLPDKASVSSAELKAILMALDYVSRSTGDKHIIFSDSLSSLQSLCNSKCKNPLVQKIVSKYSSLSSQGKDIIFCWLPSHVGISGNEKADSAAKAALGLPISDLKFPHSDFKQYRYINIYILVGKPPGTLL
jgi:ribonuclease HI